MDIFELVDNEKFFHPLSSQNRRIYYEWEFDFLENMKDEEELLFKRCIRKLLDRKNKTFCLGQEAIELNRKHAERQIQELEQQEQALGREQQQVQDGIQRITEQLDCFKAYDFDAFAKYDQAAGELNRSAEKLHELTEAQKNNLEYQTLFLQVQELEKQLEKVRKGLDQAKDRKRSLELENQSHETKLTQDRLALKDREERLEELRLLHGTETRMAMEEYDGFLAGISRTGDVMLPESRRKRLTWCQDIPERKKDTYDEFHPISKSRRPGRGSNVKRAAGRIHT